jgi:hypothetical protein
MIDVEQSLKTFRPEYNQWMLEENEKEELELLKPLCPVV